MSLINILNLNNNAKLLQFQQGLFLKLKRSLVIFSILLITFKYYIQKAIEIN